MTGAEKVHAGLLLIQLGTELATGKVTDALATAKKIMTIAIDLIPVEELRPHLTDRDRAWVDLSVDIAEAIKVDAAADAAEREKVGP